MELRLLTYFLAVAREGNITHAAETLHITQPTLSRQMAQLEREVGVSLFHREGHRLTLTDEGLLLRRRASEILELVDKTERELADHDRSLEGTVAIGVGDVRAVSELARLIRDFRQEHPRVTFDLYTATADLIADRMDRGLADIGLMLEPVDVARYEFVRMHADEHWVVALRPDDPLAAHSALTAADLADVPLLLPRRGGIRSVIENWFDAAGVRPQVAMTGNLNAGSAVMAVEGTAYPMVVEGSLSLWDPARIACRPLDPELRASSVLVWEREKPRGAATARFIEYVRAAI